MTLTRPEFAVNNIQSLETIVQNQGTAVKVLFDKAGADAKTYLISLCDQLDLDFATKLDLVNAILSEFPDGSILDIKLSDVAGQIKERLTSFIATKGVANGLASLGAEGKMPATQMPVMIRGVSTQTASFPVRTGTGPYVYTYVTIAIPITESMDEVDIEVGAAQIKLFRGLNYAILNNYSISSQEGYVPRIISVNTGLGETTDTPVGIANVGTFFAGTNIKLSDAYISGSNLIIKAYNSTSSVIDSVSQTFEYIARG